jgi:predicted RNA methylase
MNLMKHNIIWFFFKPIAHLGIWANNKRREYVLYRESLNDPNITIFNDIFKDKYVLNGPFKSMKYPSIDSFGTTVYPKLLGSYEKELHPFLDRMKYIEFETIVDIGCAEGYYAVGMAIKFRVNRVIAFDTNPKAQLMCSEMAKLNSISEKIVISGTCLTKDLLDLDTNKTHLIISDCEGYEYQLFTKELAFHLKKSYFIIEIHHGSNINIEKTLENCFQDTHIIEKAHSSDDFYKAFDYHYSEIDHLNLDQKKIVLQECRQYIMTWLIISPQHISN